jgi:hypothetical protein
LSYPNKAKAQADTVLKTCTKYIKHPFISDGQQYKALLAGEETAEFRITFYGGSIYRIVGGSGIRDGNLIFSVYDNEHRLLFTNADHNNTPYWDFKFKSTMNCIVEAKLANTNSSGFAIILVGFKK